MGRTGSRKKLGATVAATLMFTALYPVGGQAFAAEAESTQDAVSEHSLDETVVTATRTPVQELKANANITVITGKDIEKRHYTDLTQALRDVPGVTVNQYAPAGYNNSTKFYINGSEDVVVLIDGVKQNYAGGSAASLASAMKDLSGIDRIEVLRGSASTLYGSDAKGGVINIITKKAKNAKATVEAAYGSFGKQLYSVAYEGSENGLDWRLKYQKDKSNDFKDGHGNEVPSGLDADSVNIHIGKDLSKASYLVFNLRSYKDGDRYQALYEMQQGLKQNRGRYDHFDADLIWNAKIDDTSKNQMVLSRSRYNYNIFTYGTWTPLGSSYEMDVYGWKFSDQYDKRLGDHLLTTGVDFTYDDTSIWNGGRVSINGRSLVNRSVYLQDQWNITPALKLIGGIRYDSNSAFGSHTSPSVSLGYDITPRTHAYVAYTEYFLTPTPNQLYAPIYGNPNLKPESGNTREIGIAHDFGKGLNVAAHYYWRHSEDRIGYDPMTYVNINVGDEDAHGWDLQLAKRFDSHVSARLGYTNTHVDKTEQRDVNVDGYLPAHQWNIGVDYKNRRFDASLMARAMIDRPGPVDNAFPETSYWVCDFGMNYKIMETTKVYLRVNNLFDKFYAEHSNVKWGGPGQWWTAPGRSFVIGVEHSF
ncbi:TonB-dependent receptor [uncultured Selenomonas sp.]|uniref:TonB-dependent receptor plug domain-containing protein n=1 Tax=uncultured Selenomonas sp. TaxID=159275 RepID=UPI0028EA7C0F|nr:TonB-dependent receptor [uncultured Selenomonas sp.]